MKKVSPVWAKVIAPAMKRQGIKTLVRLSEESAVSQRTLSYIKSGTTSNITTGILGKLASALSVNVTDLMLFF